MIAWRLCRDPFADLTGEGARLYGGRWNPPGQAVVYTADSPALAFLEVRVHLDLPPELLPEDYVLLGIDLDDAPVEVCVDIPEEPVGFGRLWLQSLRSPILQVPSAMVPESSNLLINPLHPQAAAVTVRSKRSFCFDERLWLIR